MDSLSTIVVVVVLLGLFFFVVGSFESETAPSPGIGEYLPGGIIFPIFKDQRTLVRVLDRLSRKYGDVFQIRLGFASVVLTAVPEDIIHINSDASNFSRSKRIIAAAQTIAPNGFFTMTGAIHGLIRKKLRENFNYAMIDDFHSHIMDAVDDLCGNLTSAVQEAGTKGKPQVTDISKEIAVTTNRIITNVAFGFGMTHSERLQFAEIINSLMEELMREFMGYPFRQVFGFLGTRSKIVECKSRMEKICRKFLEMRVAETKEQNAARPRDLLDAMLSLNEAGANIISMIIDFSIGGTHTTNQVLSWCIYEICCHPEVEKRIYRELDEHLGDRPTSEKLAMDDVKDLTYLCHVWNETLRIHNIGPGAVKQTVSDVILKGSGTFVPKGTSIITHNARVQTHEAIWRDAMTFKPERWESGGDVKNGKRPPPGAFCPFSTGAMNCPGRFLADYEAAVILAGLYRKFRFTLACDRSDVVGCTCLGEVPKTASVKGGPLDRGIPVIIEMR